MMYRREMVMGSILTLALAVPLRAQPSTKPLPPSQLDTGSAVRDVYSFTLPAPAAPAPEEGAANPDYRIGVLVPKGPAPAKGWPILYMLDGQAVMERLTDEILAKIPQAAQRIIVTVGYQTPQRFATAARARDYTPPDPKGLAIKDPRTGTSAGHADSFLHLLGTQIIPRAESFAPVDPQERTLWGHSYGGLFVLYAASQPDSPFVAFTSASPALWWDEARIGPAFEAQMRAGRWSRRPLDIHIGSAERAKATDPGTKQTEAFVKMRGALPEHALEDLVSTARAAGIPGQFTQFPGLSHGQSFVASLYKTVGVAE
ncbi:alpha/beta hydrolase-fold protein [Thioclava sp. GXIMD4215]|uniref:alpha/beta hydrolase n=1 Tax=Thioclava sp. GXIMD4215 TaxID=3131928 RepID=UPI00311AC036